MKQLLLYLAAFVACLFFGCGRSIEPLNIKAPLTPNIQKYEKSVAVYFDESLNNAKAWGMGYKKISVGDTLKNHINLILESYFSKEEVVPNKEIGTNDYLMIFSLIEDLGKWDNCKNGKFFLTQGYHGNFAWYCKYYVKLEVINSKGESVYTTDVIGEKVCQTVITQEDNLWLPKAMKKYKANDVCTIEGAINDFLSSFISKIENNKIFAQ